MVWGLTKYLILQTYSWPKCIQWFLFPSNPIAKCSKARARPGNLSTLTWVNIVWASQKYTLPYQVSHCTGAQCFSFMLTNEPLWKLNFINLITFLKCYLKGHYSIFLSQKSFVFYQHADACVNVCRYTHIHILRGGSYRWMCIFLFLNGIQTCYSS